MLPQRVGAGQVPQLADHLGLAAHVQIRVNACFQRLQPQLRQPRRLPHRQELRVHIGQRLTPP